MMRRYLDGETLLEANWKSVAMPGQGLFIGDPLARPYGTNVIHARHIAVTPPGYRDGPYTGAEKTIDGHRF